jgi:hypothetical protein
MFRCKQVFALSLFIWVKAIGLAAIAIHFGTSPAYATDEIQVYNAEIAPKGVFTIQQHLNYVWNGSTTPDFPGGFASNHTLNGTPEFAYGVTDWYEAGFYVPFAFASDGTFLPGGVKVRQLFVSPHAEDRKVFYGINFELSYQAPQFSQSAIGLEIRPILGVRDFGWEFIVNPIVDLSFAPSGDSAFAPAVRLANNISGDTWLGVEYYSSYSPIDAIPPSNQQQHSLFGVVDFKAFGLDVDLGVGFGLTDASDRIVGKIIIGRAF